MCRYIVSTCSCFLQKSTFTPVVGPCGKPASVPQTPGESAHSGRQKGHKPTEQKKSERILGSSIGIAGPLLSTTSVFVSPSFLSFPFCVRPLSEWPLLSEVRTILPLTI